MVRLILAVAIVMAVSGCGGQRVKRHKLGFFWDIETARPPAEARPDVTT